ncbi:HNH endonuclease [candidate division KSB1 bacterium]|nr:HNH endonuclease [candidate division KSB1 bacterium]
MSKKINQTISGIEEIRENSRIQPNNWTIRRIRNEATKAMAVRLNRKKQTVESKFITQLKPHIKNAQHFDELVKRWLFDDSVELQNILLRYATSKDDKEKINNLFYKAPESDILLAQEFGYNPADKQFKDAKEKLKIHLVKERNRNLVSSAKQQWSQQQNGDINCSICSFSFKEKYGKIGEGFIEAHHILPISSLAPDTIVKISELIPVCSNCHSMLHRHRSSITAEELRNIVMTSSN